MAIPVQADRLAFSPDGALLAMHTKGGPYEVWDLRRDEHAATLEPTARYGHPGTMVFTPDGSLLATTERGSVARLWRMPSGQPAGILEFGEPPPFPEPEPYVLGLAMSQDGRTMVSSDSSGEVRLWNLPAGTPASLMHRGRPIGDLVMSQTGGVLAGADCDGAVHIWMPRILAAALTPTSRLTLADAETMHTLADPSEGERPWSELITRLIERRHRHDIEIDGDPVFGPGDRDIALEPAPGET
jgi:WD40 repeat protein